MITSKSNQLEITPAFSRRVVELLGGAAKANIPVQERKAFSRSLDLFLYVHKPYIDKQTNETAYALAFDVDEAIKRRSASPVKQESYSQLVDMIAGYIQRRLTTGMDRQKFKDVADYIDTKAGVFKRRMLQRIALYQGDYLCPGFRSHDDKDLMKDIEKSIADYKFGPYTEKIDKTRYEMYVDRTFSILEEIAITHILVRQVDRKVTNHEKWGPMIYRATSYDKNVVPPKMRAAQWPVIILMQPKSEMKPEQAVSQSK